ncbi:MAG TPA: ABC transporter ATP-binding protein [Azospirillaceae bacterium]|nr:ABC transporter ATP-binding protein [Azospirillaceae bacterium]
MGRVANLYASAVGGKSRAQADTSGREAVERGTKPLLEVDGVTLQYKTKESLVTATYRVSFNVYQGDRYILLGPSGCGKSTLLKGVAGFLKPVEGDIRLNDRHIDGPGPDRMMVFQEFDQLLPWKTVRQNVLFPMKTCGKRECEDKADAVIEKVGLSKFANSYPHMLSGGMKQRVAIARAMAMEPDILLMDEPYAALDALTRRRMQDELLMLWDDIRFTVMFVTHSIQEAIIVGNRILVLSPHPGQVRAELNSDAHNRENVKDSSFADLEARINDMLFAEHAVVGAQGE